MKKNNFYTILLILVTSLSWAQTTETFETETAGSTSFTDNGQVFNITTQLSGAQPFDIFSSGTAYGWNGSGTDFRFIDNSGGTVNGQGVGFTISSAGAVPFRLNSMYLYLANAAANVAVSGNLTIVGKLGGVTKFTATASSGFNTSSGVNNGFTFINMTTFGGSNNSSTSIDQIVITTGGQFEYVALDAFTWTVVTPLTAVTSFTAVSCNGGGNGRASVSASGGSGGYTYAWAPSGGTASLATGLGAATYTCTITDASSTQITKTVTVNQPSAISATPGFTNVSCNGGGNGRASVSVTGGTPSYFYSWSPSGGTASLATGLGFGTYTCTITDNNSCTKTQTVTVTQPSAISTATSVVNISCNGGSNGVTAVSASGGAGSFTYTWSPTGGNSAVATGLSVGIYTVTVQDANGCIVTRNAAVTQPSALVTSTAITNVACNGGSNGVASITASGGAGGYTYLWSNGGTTSAITGLLAGVYTATVTDANSCTSVKAASVTQPSALITTTAVTNVACNGGSNGVASITASGGAGSYTYLWSNGGTTSAITGLLAGVYTATVTDANSCTSVKSANITQPSALVTTTAVTNVACNSGSNGVASITASGGAGGYTYLWSNGGTTSAITGLLAGVYTATVTDANSCTSIKSANITQPSALVTTTAVTNVACNGGSNGVASITASGGAGSYTYLWSNGGTTSAITGLLAGVYTATVTDANSCTSVKSANITQPSALVTTTAVTNVACNGGSNGVASITASGGAGSYTYLWSNGGTTSAITGLLAGVYTATVTDANSCTSVKSANVTQPSALVTTTAVTNVACNGGSNGVASITASGGAGSYTYLWSNGGTTSAITGLLAGVYTATVTDANSCTSVKAASVTQPSALATTTTVTNVACNGGSNGAASITASGGVGGYAYLWSNGGTTSAITGLLAGVYTATVTDANSCTSIKSANITQPSALATTTAVTNVACNGGSNGVASITASGGTGGYTYLWSNGGTTSSITGLLAGVYTATVTDANSCTSIKSANVTQPSSALSATTSFTNVSCFGAANGKASVSATGGTSPYSYSWAPSGGTAATATGLAPNTYTCTITDNNTCSATRTVTVSQPATAVSATTSFTNVSCFGAANGAASVLATGGTSPYTYSWTPSGGTTATATGLTANTYSCAITDNNSCILTKTVVVTQPASGITATTSFTNVSCFGAANGAASVSATGGTLPYTYAWAPSGGTASTATGLAPNTYTCTIADNNTCSITKTVTVSQPAAPLSATTSFTNVSCFGGANGKASVSATGGTSPYTYSWTPSGGTATTATGLAPNIYTCTITDNNTCSTTRTVTISQPATAVSATASFTNVTCFGSSNGTASVSATGGTSPYTYSWSPSGGTAALASGLTANVYTYTVTDNNNCTLTQTVTIAQPTAVNATTSFTNATCFGGSNGSASVLVTGGTSPYTYSWTPTGGTAVTATGLSANVYTCTITDNNSCTLTKTVSITQPTAIAATISSTNTACVGNSGMTAVSGVSGGTGAYTYSWSPTGGTAATASSLGVGIYTCTVQDANTCSLTLTTTVNTINGPAISVSSQTNISCAGGSNGAAQVSVTGGTIPYTYSWTPGTSTTTVAVGLTAGTYSCVVTDNSGCTAIQGINISQPAPLMVSSVITSSVLCNGGVATISVSATGGTAAYTGTGTFTATAGSQTYTVTDINSCTSTTSITVTEPAVIMASASAQAIYCHSGATTITVTATGGTIPYTGTGTFTATAGNYSYTVTDSHSCPVSTATINLVDPAVIMTTQSFSLCTGQSVTVGTNTYSAAGTYTDMVTTVHGCDSTITTNIIVNSLPTVTVTPTTATVCAGSPVSLTAGGATTYTWSNGGSGNTHTVSPTANTIYTVTGKDVNLCQNTATVNITVNSAPSVSATASSTLVCKGQTVTLTGQGAVTYTWTGGVTNGTAFTPTNTITYTVTGQGANTCKATAAITVSVSPCTGIESLVTANDAIDVFPNPGNGNYTIRFTNTDVKTVWVYDVTGRVVYENINTHDTTLQMNIINEPKGIYFVKIQSGNMVSVKKIINQ